MMEYFYTHKGLTLFLLFIVLAGSYLWLKKPTHQSNWQPAQSLLPEITLADDHFRITGIRDFRYDDKKEIIAQSFLDQTYSYNSLKQLWFGLSHFGDNGLAHAFLSFEFSDRQFLTLSIEARMKDDQRYHPILGLLNRYEKMYIFGTEADIIGLRTHSRGENVLLYPIIIDHQSQVQLLKTYLTEAHTLETTPDFYNTVLDNCLTGILRASGHFSSWDFLTNSRLIFPGRSDELAQQMGLIDNSVSLELLRKKATVDSSQSNPAEPSFSQRIRSGWQIQ